MLVNFHIVLNIFLLLSAIFVLLSENSVHSILFLVLTFLNAAIICFIFGADFLGLLLIIIYVGAIAVLFLFVIMMLNVKTQKFKIFNFMPFLLVLSFILFFELYTLTSNFLSNFDFLQYSFVLFDSLSNDFFLGQTLYNYYLICFLISGIILLVGMLGAIILTLNFNNKKRVEIPFKQLSRSNTIISFFK